MMPGICTAYTARLLSSRAAQAVAGSLNDEHLDSSAPHNYSQCRQKHIGGRPPGVGGATDFKHKGIEGQVTWHSSLTGTSIARRFPRKDGRAQLGALSLVCSCFGLHSKIRRHFSACRIRRKIPPLWGRGGEVGGGGRQPRLAQEFDDVPLKVLGGAAVEKRGSPSGIPPPARGIEWTIKRK